MSRPVPPVRPQASGLPHTHEIVRALGRPRRSRAEAGAVVLRGLWHLGRAAGRAAGRTALIGLSGSALLVALAWVSGGLGPARALPRADRLIASAAGAPGSPARAVECAVIARTREAVGVRTAVIDAWHLAPLPEGLLTRLWVLTIPAPIGGTFAEHAAMVRIGPWWVLAWNAARPPTTADLYHEMVHRVTDETTPARRAATWRVLAAADHKGTVRAQVVAAAWGSVHASVAWGESPTERHQMERVTTPILTGADSVDRLARLASAVAQAWAAPATVGRRLAVTLRYAPAFVHGIPVEAALTDDLAQETVAYALAWACADTPTRSTPPPAVTTVRPE